MAAFFHFDILKVSCNNPVSSIDSLSLNPMFGLKNHMELIENGPCSGMTHLRTKSYLWLLEA